jgi:hypothetical protein
MQEIFVCCAAGDAGLAEAVASELRLFDAVTVLVEPCETGELPYACEAAAGADGLVLLITPEAVPRQVTREVWAPVLQWQERAPGSLFCLSASGASYPALLRAACTPVESGNWPAALRRWVVALGEPEDGRRFEPVGFEDQDEFRDVIWIPCAGREEVSVQEDLRHAADGRRVLIVLDDPREGLPLPPLTREVVRRQTEGGGLAAGEVPAVVAACYPDFLHRDFCARLTGVEASALTGCLEPITRDGRILRVPRDARRALAVDAAPRRRHFELLLEYLADSAAAEHMKMIRLELPAALAYAFATDWNSAAGLTWRAYGLLREDYSREAASYLLRLRQSALEQSVQSWVQLCERELQWLGVEPPPVEDPPRKKAGKRDNRQLRLDW